MKSQSPTHEEFQASEYVSPFIDDMDMRVFPYSNTGTTYDAGGLNDYSGYQTNVASQIDDCSAITAANKPLMVISNVDDNWRTNHPRHWTRSQLTKWFIHVCSEKKLNYENVRYKLDNVTGEYLQCMDKNNFRSRFPYEGDVIFEAYQEVLRQWQHIENSTNSCYQLPTSYYDNLEVQNSTNGDIVNNNTINNNNHLHQYSNGGYMNGGGAAHYPQNYYDDGCLMLSSHCPSGNIKAEVDSEGESNQSLTFDTINSGVYCLDSMVSQNENPELQRRRRGRPQSKDKKKNKNGQRSSRLWEFIRDLLLDTKTCPSLLKWENADEGIFRFVQSDKVARLWGERKCNPKMTYEKLSRAMRYYYKSQVFQPVIGRRLVYKFGPNATGWRPKKGTTTYKLPMVTQLDG